MKNYSSKRCSKGKTAYRTPSRFRALSSIKNRGMKPGSKKGKPDKFRPNK